MQIETDVLLWMTLGIALLSSEAFTGSFHLLFLGLASLATAVLASTGIHSIAIQFALFSGLSLFGFLIIKATSSKKKRRLTLIEQQKTIVMPCDLMPEGKVTLQYQGATWDVKNNSLKALKKDETVVVDKIEGITLILSK